MKLALVKTLVYGMSKRGFKHEGQGKFARRGANRAEKLQIQCTDAAEGHYISTDVAVRFDLIESIYHRASGFEQRYQDTFTVGQSIARLLQPEPPFSIHTGRYHLSSTADLASIAEHVMASFDQVASPFFAHWTDIDVLDAEANAMPNEIFAPISNNVFRCAKGLIAAKLAGRVNYQELKLVYRRSMEIGSKGFYLKRFDPLVALLDSHTIAELTRM